MANIFCPVCHIVSISQMRRYNLQKGRLLYFILTGEKLGYFEKMTTFSEIITLRVEHFVGSDSNNCYCL